MKKYVKASRAKFTVKNDYFFPVKQDLDKAIEDAWGIVRAKRGIDGKIANQAQKIAEILERAKYEIEVLNSYPVDDE